MVVAHTGDTVVGRSVQFQQRVAGVRRDENHVRKATGADL